MPAPSSFARELMTDWSRWVIDHDLPPLPDDVAPGESVPVARWAGQSSAVVLHVQRGDGEGYAEVFEVFVRGADGWERQSRGEGGDRPGPPFAPPEFPARTAELYGELTSSRADGRHVRSVDGAARADGPVLVEIQRGDELERQPVASHMGLVVAAWVQEPGDRRTTIVRVVDEQHRSLTTASFAAL
jgi:hypothetical protein